LSKHGVHEDVHIKHEHLVGQGPFQIAGSQENVHMASSDDDNVSGDEDVFGDDAVLGVDGQDQEEEQLDEESYRAIK